MRYLLICIVFCGCASQKSIVDLCADKFLIKDSIIFVDKYDTIFEFKPQDTLYLWDNKYIHDTTRIKSIKTIIKYKEKMIYRENLAKVESLNKENKKLLDENKVKQDTIVELKEKLKVYRGVRNMFIAVLLLALIFSVIIKTISKKW